MGVFVQFAVVVAAIVGSGADGVKRSVLSPSLVYSVPHDSVSGSLQFEAGHLVNVTFSPPDLKMSLGATGNVSLLFRPSLAEEAVLVFTYQQGDTISSSQEKAIVQPLANISLGLNTSSASIRIVGVGIGSVIVGLNSTSGQFADLLSTFLRVMVVRSLPLVVINQVIGWIYFVAWSISFYPQVFSNFKRKSVIGLNFDFVTYNLLGFSAYGVFNVAMYWIDEIKHEYFVQHPRGVNPVQLNDVVFTLHAAAITAFTIFQCCIYTRGGQRVSRVCMVLAGGALLFAITMFFLGLGRVVSWLTFINCFSYIKLGVTLIKYVPQAFMNYRRKSTEGWSIGNVLLDLTGGSFSLLQMFLISYNNDDWGSIFGDPTKFGLGFFSICFDVLFIVQHYCLYRQHTPYNKLTGEDRESSPDRTDSTNTRTEDT